MVQNTKKQLIQKLKTSTLLSSDAKLRLIEMTSSISDKGCEKLLKLMDKEPGLIKTLLEKTLTDALINGDKETLGKFKQVLRKAKRGVVGAEEEHSTKLEEEDLSSLEDQIDNL